jgi:hypothetical protein
LGPRPESGKCRQIQDCAAIRIHNLYQDANGESHFRDIEVDWVEETPTGKLSKRLPATGIMFREGVRPLRAIRATPADGRVDEEADLRTNFYT